MITADLAEFVERASEAFERASSRLGIVDRRYRIGPETLQLLTAGVEFADALDATFAHLRLDDQAMPTLTISAWDEVTSGVSMPPAPWTADSYQDTGQIGLDDSDRFAAAYQLGAYSLSMFDRALRSGLYWTRDAGSLPYWELSFPFRFIFHWAFATTSLQPLHAGAVGTEHGGVLIGGRSGIGKTTTTISCVQGGMRYAADDYVLVDSQTPAQVYSLYNTAKFTVDSLERFPQYASAVCNPLRDDDQKALVYGHIAFPRQLVGQMPIRAIAVPRVTGLAETTIAAISPAVAVRALAPTTIAHLPGHGLSTMAKVIALCRSVPCLEIAVGTDLARIPGVITEWLDGAVG